MRRRVLKNAVAVACAVLMLLALQAGVSARMQAVASEGAATLGWHLVDAGTDNGLTCVTAPGANNIYIGGAHPNPELLWSGNGGASWNHHVPSRQVLGISASGPSDVWAAGLDRIFHTGDGGASWDEINPGFGTYFGICAVSSQVVWAVGESGAIARTTDGGATWKNCKKTGYADFMMSVAAVSASKAWAVSSTDGSILKTTNGGDSWTVNSPAMSLNSITAVDSQVLWAAGDGIYKSTNGGNSWKKQYSGPYGLYSIAAVDNETAWAVGHRGTMLKTVDGGKTWFPQNPRVSAEINGVACVNANVAWAVGPGGIVLHTTDGGGYRNPPRINTVVPSSGRIGSEVTVSGSDFGNNRSYSYVDFGGVQAQEYTAWNDNRIIAVIPEGAEGVVDLTVVTPGGRSNAKSFTVITPTYYSYYFAEGCTREGFSQWVCVQNPGSAELRVDATYMLFGGEPVNRSYQIDPTSRLSINVNEEVGPGQDVSVQLVAEGEFYAERAMYFDYKQGQPGFSWTGGHCEKGAIAPASDWYFAEGTTREGFEEWICIQNPNPFEVEASVNYISAGAYAQQKRYMVDPSSRISVFVNGDVGPDQDVSTHVHCDDAIIVERPMYFDYQGRWDGGHVVMGTDSPKYAWYFAEGTTRPGYEEYLAVQNANNENANLTIRFLTEGEETVGQEVVGANSRWTLSVNDKLGPGVDSSVIIESDQPVVAERPMYFSYKQDTPGYGWNGGHDVVGAPSAKTMWFFAEGCTLSNFDEYLCVGNPGLETARVEIEFMLENGDVVDHTLNVASKTRTTLKVRDVVGAGHDVSASLVSDQPVVVERPVYFSYDGWNGGHNVVGF